MLHDWQLIQTSWPWLAQALAVGYLIGSIPTGLILSRLMGLGDLRKIGSGNIGATNVLRTVGLLPALIVLLLDGGKGYVAVELGRRLRLDPWPGEWIHANGEYTDKGSDVRKVAVCIGPEHGTVGRDLVKEAAKEAVKGVGYDLLQSFAVVANGVLPFLETEVVCEGGVPGRLDARRGRCSTF